jgi:hypothetical protein
MKDRFERDAKVELWIQKQADQFTSTFPKPGKPLDYSEYSLRHLDELCQELNKTLASGPKRLAAVYGAGSYYGEVIDRNLGGRWIYTPQSATPFLSTYEVEGRESVGPFKIAEQVFNGEEEGFDPLFRQLKGVPTLSPTPMKKVAFTITIEDFGPKKAEVADLVMGMFHLPPESKFQVFDGTLLPRLTFPTRSHVEAFVDQVAALGAKATIRPLRKPAAKAKHPLSPGQPERLAEEAIRRLTPPGKEPDARRLLVAWSVTQKGELFYIEEKDFGIHEGLYFKTKADAAEFLSDLCLRMMKGATQVIPKIMQSDQGPP